MTDPYWDETQRLYALASAAWNCANLAYRRKDQTSYERALKLMNKYEHKWRHAVAAWKKHRA